MDFHLEFSPKIFGTTIRHQDHLMLIGSCFTEQIGNKLAKHKFRVLDNPNGILFNPISITKSIHSYIVKRQYQEADLFYQNECWNSWEHHSRFSNPDKEQCLLLINESQNRANSFLRQADWLLLTLGSAFVYEIVPLKATEQPFVVANCHKVPTDKFSKRLLSEREVLNSLLEMTHALVKFNPELKIIFTISPVRHIREGFVENNRSKAILINAVHQITGRHVFYFPAYELVIDDLRDYRFYAEDMVHPNYIATNYVWDKFVTTCIDEGSRNLMKEIKEITAAFNHKAFNPASEAHRKFKIIYSQKVEQLMEKYPYLQLEKEFEYFKRGVGSSTE